MAAKSLRVLLVASSAQDIPILLAKLADAGYAASSICVQTAADMRAALQAHAFDIVLCTDDAGSFGSPEAYALLRQIDTDTPFLLLAHEAGKEPPLPTMQEGGDDYILKSSLDRLVPAIEHHLRAARMRQQCREAQLALEENQARMQAFITDLPGMAYRITLDDQGTVSFPSASEGCLPLLGIPPQELVGDADLFDTMLHPEDVDSYHDSMLESARRLSFWNWEGRIRTRYGNEIKWINLRCTPRRTGSAVQWEGIMLNITRNKDAESALRQSQLQLRALSSHIEGAREQERVAIAREVHDELGSLLTAARLEIAWLVSRLQDQPAIEEKALAIEDLIQRCTRSASNIARSLRPSALDTFGIIAAIESETNEFSQRTDINCILKEMDESVSVTPQVAITLFRILQEALANVTKHAHARTVTLTLRNLDTCVNLTIHDDGRGLAETDRAKPHAFGLRGIYERVAQFGGEMELTSAPGKGTRLDIRIPHQSAQQADPDAREAPLG
jgi:signal transduction histidine kinase/CheY-like chemotaxis protein